MADYERQRWRRREGKQIMARISSAAAGTAATATTMNAIELARNEDVDANMIFGAGHIVRDKFSTV